MIMLRPRVAKSIGAAVCVGVLALYALFATNSAYFTRDPVHTAHTILERPVTRLFDPHHLIYMPTGKVLYRLGVPVGIGSPIIALQALGIVTGALGVGVFYRLVLALTGEYRISLIAGLLLAFSYGYWRFAVEAMPYPVTMLFLIAAAYFLVKGIAPTSTWRDYALSGTMASLATLYDQRSLFLVVVVLVALWIQRHEQQHLARKVTAFAVLFTVGVVLPYLLVIVFVEQARSLEEVKRYLFHYAYALSDSLGVGQFSLLRSLKGVIGLGNLFVGEVFVLDFVASRPPLAQSLVALTPALSLPPAEYAHRSLLETGTLAVLAAIVFGLLGYFAAYFVRHLRRLWTNHRVILIFCLAWALPNIAFALWYFPENVHFWIPNLVPMGILFALILRDARKHRKGWWSGRLVTGAGVLLVALLFGVNFFGSILPARRPEANWNRQAASLIARYATKDDLIINLGVGEYKHLQPYVIYYAKAAIWPVGGIAFDGRSSEDVTQAIDHYLEQGRHVYVFPDVFTSELGYIGLSKLSGVSEEQIKQQVAGLLSSYQLKAVAHEHGRPALYELTRPIK